jgi:hypothetical protein
MDPDPKMMISLQYCLSPHISLPVWITSDSSSGHSQQPLPASLHSDLTPSPTSGRHSPPYYIAGRIFLDPSEAVHFTLHLLQIEIMKYLPEICSSPLSSPPLSAPAAVVVDPVAKKPFSFSSEPEPGPEVVSLSEGQGQEQEQRLRWPHQRIWSEETEKELTIDSVHSHDSVTSSAAHFLPPLSVRELEAWWESRDESRTRLDSRDEDARNRTHFDQFPANFPIDNPNPSHFVSQFSPHFSSSFPDSYSTHPPLPSPLLSPLPSPPLVMRSAVASPPYASTPTSAVSASSVSVPMPIALQFIMNSNDNDLLIQGRHGIGSFDVIVICDDRTVISLGVTGQFMNVIFASSHPLATTSSSSSFPSSSSSSSDERIESCHIHLDIVALALAYLQAIQETSETKAEGEGGSDDASGSPIVDSNSMTCCCSGDLSSEDRHLQDTSSPDGLSSRFFKDSSVDPLL